MSVQLMTSDRWTLERERCGGSARRSSSSPFACVWLRQKMSLQRRTDNREIDGQTPAIIYISPLPTIDIEHKPYHDHGDIAAIAIAIAYHTTTPCGRTCPSSPSFAYYYAALLFGTRMPSRLLLRAITQMLLDHRCRDEEQFLFQRHTSSMV